VAEVLVEAESYLLTRRLSSRETEQSPGPGVVPATPARAARYGRRSRQMLRTILLAVAVVAVVAVGYFLVFDVTEPDRAAEVTSTTVTPPATSEAVVEENMSNRAASDAATDEAFESALEGEEPVQPNLESSRGAAEATGAVGAAAFTPEGYDRTTVVVAIENSDLEEAEKDRLMELLAEIELQDGELEPALAQIRAALELEL
jgi:hypothetical protein